MNDHVASPWNLRSCSHSGATEFGTITKDRPTFKILSTIFRRLVWLFSNAEQVVIRGNRVATRLLTVKILLLSYLNSEKMTGFTTI